MTTAAIELLTGLPGAGKTLRMVKRIKEELASGRAVFVCNLNGLNLSGVIPFEDPTRWRELPPGSILFVDEAQRFFRARRSGEPATYLTAMETIRHDAVTLFLATQQPSYLDVHIRGLVGKHEHLVRKNGAEKSYLFRSDEVMDDPKSLRARINADTETFRFEPELYTAYTSAEVHTMKWKMSSKAKRAIAIAAVAVVFLGICMIPMAKRWMGEGSAGVVASAEPTPGVGADLVRTREKPPLTTEQYVRQQVPRLANQPWSAPIFDGRQAQSQPQLLCMSSASSCTCMTEQATIYQTTGPMCRRIARFGPAYNPFKAPEVDQRRAERKAEDDALRGAPPFDSARPGDAAGVRTDPQQVGARGQDEVWGKPQRPGV